MIREVSRRRLLGATAGGSATLVAGCLGDDGPGSSDPDDTDDSNDADANDGDATFDDEPGLLADNERDAAVAMIEVAYSEDAESIAALTPHELTEDLEYEAIVEFFERVEEIDRAVDNITYECSTEVYTDGEEPPYDEFADVNAEWWELRYHADITFDDDARAAPVGVSLVGLGERWYLTNIGTGPDADQVRC